MGAQAAGAAGACHVVPGAALSGGCRCVQFKRAFKRNDKPICLAVVKFIAHLTNQQVVFELLALQIMMLLLENPSGAARIRGEPQPYTLHSLQFARPPAARGWLCSRAG